MVSGRPVTIASRLRSIPSSSLFIGTTKASMPVAQQLVGDVVEVDAGLAQRLEVGGRVVGRGLLLTSPSRAAAVSVGSGIVLTVSRPTRP